MDEELTGGYSEPCAQCGAISWAVSAEEQFFCKNCHNVIEKTMNVEAIDGTTWLLNHRISSFSSRSRKKAGREGGRDWMVCEGFQFILKHQAKALVGLGVCPQFETQVLWDFWKIYLQKTRQAYTRAPANSGNPVDQTSESEPESGSLSEASHYSGFTVGSGYSSDGSGSLDASYYFMKDGKRHNLMNMPRTLALCHLALLWLREGITLTDLLRLASKKLVPYINIHEDFPEEIKFFGKEAIIFRSEGIPSYTRVHREAMRLGKIMQLSVFPPVSPDCLLHPALLSLRYLIDANLPDELHPLVCQVIEKTGMGKSFFLTYDPSGLGYKLQCYDLQAAALIIVTMKLLFRLDDRVEWTLSRTAEKDKDQGKKKSKQGSRLFSLRRWCMIMQPVLEKAGNREKMFEARREWKSKKPVIPRLQNKSVVLKKRRVVEQLQSSFYTLTDSAPEPEPSSMSSFLFLWGQEEGADGPSLHHERLSYVLKKQGKEKLLINNKYWHTALRLCAHQCSDHFAEVEPSLPRMYVWILGLFSFILGVTEAQLHEEVVHVERRLLADKTKPQDRDLCLEGCEYSVLVWG